MFIYLFIFFCFVLISSALFFSTENSFGDTIQPWFPEKHGSEDENVTLSCNYSLSSGTNVNFQWYRQYPEAKPEFLLLVTEYSSKTEPELRLYSEAKKKSNVWIWRSSLLLYQTLLCTTALYSPQWQKTLNTVQKSGIQNCICITQNSFSNYTKTVTKY